MKSYLATYYYVSPDDTLAEGEKPNVQVHTGIFSTLDNALEFIGELFDGQATWNDSYVPKIKAHFTFYNEEFAIDDYSAGQWAVVMEFKGKDIHYSF